MITRSLATNCVATLLAIHDSNLVLGARPSILSGESDERRPDPKVISQGYLPRAPSNRRREIECEPDATITGIRERESGHRFWPQQKRTAAYRDHRTRSKCSFIWIYEGLACSWISHDYPARPYSIASSAAAISAFVGRSRKSVSTLIQRTRPFASSTNTAGCGIPSSFLPAYASSRRA